jgi:hypothetical protein
MNGNGQNSLKQQAVSKAKAVAGAAANGSKKRKKDLLKPIITTDKQQSATGNPYR